MKDGLVERVARAIEECPLYPPETYHERRGRAAIQAMREPTEAMMEEFVLADSPTDDGFRRAWAAAIDAALSE